MQLIVLASALLLVSLSATLAEPAKKTYRNPLIADHNLADPHVIRVGDKYYLYESEHGTGCEVYLSDDLVRWELQDKQAFVDPRGGVWAPDVFHHQQGDGKFYLYYTDNAEPEQNRKTPKKQIGVAMSGSPLGPFMDKGVLATSAIDAHLFGDDTGLFLYYVDRTQGFTIVVQPMSDPLTKKGETKNVLWPTESWEKLGMEITEAPFMVKHADTYYLMYSGSPAHSTNYAIGYATAKSPLGPFTKYAGNPIARRTDTILGPGHNSVVEGPDGKLWMMYHQKRSEKAGFDRFVAMDPLWFDREGVMRVKLSRDTDEPAP